MGEELMVKQKRSFVREEQRVAERAETANIGGRSSTVDTILAGSAQATAPPNAAFDGGGAGEHVQGESAEEFAGGHHFSDIAVLPREDQSDDDSSDGAPPSDQEDHLDDTTLDAADTEVEPEAKPRLDKEEGRETSRGHRFSNVDVFPREATSNSGSRDHAPAPSLGNPRTSSNGAAGPTLLTRPGGYDKAAAVGNAAVDTTPGTSTKKPELENPAAEHSRKAAVAGRAAVIPGEARVDSIEAGRQKSEPPGPDVERTAGVKGVESIAGAGVKDAERAEGFKGVAQTVGVKGVDRTDRTKDGEGSEKAELAGKNEKAAETDAEPGAAPGKGVGRAAGVEETAGTGGQPRARRGGAGGGGESADAGGAAESLGDAALDRWTAATAAATDAVPKPELPEGQAAAAAVEQTSSTLVNERVAGEPDYESEAKETQPPVPAAAEKESQLDTSEADQAVAGIQALANKRLSPATFSPIGSPPAYPGLNPRDFVPANDLKVLKDLEDRLAKTDLTKAQRASLTKQLEKVQKHIAAIEEQATKGTAPPAATTIVDEGASSLEPPPPDQAAVLGDAIARAITTIPGRGRALALSAARPLDQGKSPELQELAAGKADTVESEMREELDQIAAAAGISAEQLTGKIAEQQVAAAALAAEQDAATKTAADKGIEARAKQGVEEQAKIAGAKEAVDKEISAKESAVNGPPDTEAIEAKRDELLGKLEKTGSEVLASYRSSLDKRTTELTSTANKQKGDVRAAADRQAAAIRRHYPDDPDKGAVESLPTKNWATTAAQQVDVESGRFSTDATAENKGFIDTLNDELMAARNTVRDWAAHQEGRERSWWEQLIDMIRDWGKQAVADNAAWERQRAADSREAMAGDLDALAQLRKAQLSKNNDEVNAVFAGLDEEQKALAVKYLRGQGVDSIGFVAESTMLRIVRRRRGELTDSIKEEVLRDWDWERLGILARATNPEFQPKVIANKVKGSIAGIGTSEDKLFAALGTARGPFERAAVEKCYQATFGISMAEDVDDDVDGTEWDRAEALMKGGTADIAVATIADAIDGAGTDEDAIKEALRGKTPAELEEIKRLYKERHGVDLKTDLAGDMEDAELDNALALADGNVAQADAADLEDAMEGAGTDEEKITQVYEKIRKEVEADAKRRGLSVAEMRAEIKRRNEAVSTAYTAKYGKSLKAEFADELSGAEHVLADALDEGDPSRIDAAKAKVEDEAIVYSSDDRLEAVVRNQHARAEIEAKLDLESQRARAAEKVRSGDMDQGQYEEALAKYEKDKENLKQDVADRAKQNMKDLKGEYATMAVGGESAFDVMIEMRTQGYSEDEIKKLIENGGKLSDAEEIYYAVHGAGTDEARIKETLKGKTPEQINAIRVAYEEKHGKGSFDDDILGDLSGREDLDTGLILEMGDPSTFTAQLSAEKDPAKRAALLAKMQRYLDERLKFEQTGSIGSSMIETGSDEMNTVAQMEDALVAARRLDTAINAAGGDMTDPAVVNAQHRMDMNFAGAVEAQEQFREQIDAYADIAVQIGAAIAGIAVTIATLGAGAPFAVAAMWGAAASAATGIYMNADLRGAAYSWEEAGVDVAVGVVDVAAAGLGAKYLGPLVKQAGMLQIAAGALADGLEGVPSALLEAGLDEAIWASGDPGGALLKVGGMALGTGAAVSFGFEAAGGAYGALTGPKIKAGGALDLDLPGSSHGRPADVDVDAGGPGHGRAPDVDVPSGKMPELDIPPVADPKLAAGKAAEGDLPPNAPDHAPKSPGEGDPKVDTGAPKTDAPDASGGHQHYEGEDGIVDLDDPRNRWVVEDSMAGELPGDVASDPVASREFFEDFVRNQPELESALLRNSETGEHIVVQGSPGSVDIRSGHGAWEELISPDKLGKGRWDLVVHSHPVDASGVTPNVDRVPSGATGDFAWTVYQAQASGKAVVQEVHITTEKGPDVTRYGYDPASAEPYSIDFPGPGGKREVHTFATIDDYHKFYNQRFGGDLGPVPDDFPGVKEADKAKADTDASRRTDEPANEIDPFDDEPTVEIPITPEAPGTVPNAPKSKKTKGKPNAPVAVPTGGMTADLTTGRPGMASMVGKNAELAVRLDRAVNALDAAVGGLSAADRAAIQSRFAPTDQATGAIGAGRFKERIEALERLVELVADSPDLKSVDAQKKRVETLKTEGEQILGAYDAGTTHEESGRPIEPSAKLNAEMARLRALVAAPPEPGTDVVDGLLRIDRMQQEIARAGEVLRKNGESLWEVHSPDHPVPTAAEADVVRATIGDVGGVSAMSGADIRAATEVSKLDVLASGTLGEPLARNLGTQEGKLLTPSEIAALKTDPPGLGQRLGQMLAGYQRAHMVGPGFGDELFAGIMMAPDHFNLHTQNEGIEALMRQARERYGDVEVVINATGTRHAIPMQDGTVKYVDILETITYKVEVAGSDVLVEVKYTIGPPPKGKVTMDPSNIQGLTVEGLPTRKKRGR
jgi:hypothetical protein